MNKIVIAPDSFKGSLCADQICDIIKEAAKQIWPHAEVIGIPVADGGEGTVDAIIRAGGGKSVSVPVRDPLGRVLQAQYGVCGDRAIIEMAQASGLPLVCGENDLLKADTYGTGELIRHAVESGLKNITVAIGGSATNDGGMGALRALGVHFFDDGGAELETGGGMLERVAAADVSGARALMKDVKLTVMCDVDNPLLGECGATRIFGPQKGADAQMLERLEKGMENYASVMDDLAGRRLSEQAGAGAAGGLGYGLSAAFGAAFVRGVVGVLDAVGFDRLAEDADLIITGEGCIDGQSCYGKVLWGVGRAAAQKGISVIAFAGTVKADADELEKMGISAAFSIANGPMETGECIRDAAKLLNNAASMVFRTAALAEVR